MISIEVQDTGSQDWRPVEAWDEQPPKVVLDMALTRHLADETVAAARIGIYVNGFLIKSVPVKVGNGVKDK